MAGGPIWSEQTYVSEASDGAVQRQSAMAVNANGTRCGIRRRKCQNVDRSNRVELRRGKEFDCVGLIVGPISRTIRSRDSDVGNSLIYDEDAIAA